MGIKVTLLRTAEMGSTVTRTFEDANEWDFSCDGNLNTLTIQKGADVLCKIPTAHIESVEFV